MKNTDIKLEAAKKYIFNYLNKNNKELVSSKKICLENISKDKNEVTIKYFSIQKVLYFCDLTNYVINGKKLFTKNFISLPNGSALIKEDMGSLSNLILDENSLENELKCFTKDEIMILKKVTKYCSEFESHEDLRRLCHSEYGWRYFFTTNKNNKVIDFDLLKDHYMNSIWINKLINYMGLKEEKPH